MAARPLPELQRASGRVAVRAQHSGRLPRRGSSPKEDSHQAGAAEHASLLVLAPHVSVGPAMQAGVVGELRPDFFIPRAPRAVARVLWRCRGPPQRA